MVFFFVLEVANTLHELALGDAHLVVAGGIVDGRGCAASIVFWSLWL